MRIDEIRGKDDADLEVIQEKTRRELFEFRFKVATGESESPHRANMLRKTIARIETIQSERAQCIRGAQPHRDE